MQDFTFKPVDDDTYCIMSYEGDEEAVVIPGTYGGKPVTILYDRLFSGHDEIESIVIPEGVREIGGFMFDGCKNLRKVELPGSLTDMWQYAFVRSSIEEIIIPRNVRSIVPFTFKDCKNLKKVVLEDGVKKIHAWAFQGCDSLEELLFWHKVDIDPRAFESEKKFSPTEVTDETVG